RFDAVLQAAARENIKVVFGISDTPRWANGGRARNRAPRSGKGFNYLRDFAYAAATRYSGEYKRRDGKVLPSVSYWLAWNEPNNPILLYPQYRKVGRN